MNTLVIRTTNSELYHHGIQGQKWGVRRYQNKDGSWTSKGKEHKTIAEKKWDNKVENLNSNIKNAKAAYKAQNKIAKQASKEAHKTANRLNITKKRKAERDEAAGKLYDELEKLNKSRQDLKNAKETKKKEMVGKYAKEYDKFENMQKQSDKNWERVDKMYKDLAPTSIGRILKVMKGTINKGDEATNKYLKEWEKASEFNDKADSQWDNVHKAYLETGKTAIGRMMNNAKYDTNKAGHDLYKYLDNP